MHQGERWVFYDGNCSFCVAGVKQMSPFLKLAHFRSSPQQADWAQMLIQEADQGQVIQAIRILTEDGKLHAGADGLLEIVRRIFWAYPFYLLSFLPGVRPLLRTGYDWIAKRRKRCVSEKCSN
jgi:predicted DCC family thiol-disulfide oxidoreductase YuxK